MNMLQNFWNIFILKTSNILRKMDVCNNTIKKINGVVTMLKQMIDFKDNISYIISKNGNASIS